MFKIPTVLTSDELLDKAFRKAGKISEKTKIRNKLKRRRNLVIAKLNTVTDVLDSKLNQYITTFPSFNQLHPFDFELIDIIIGIDKLRKSLGALDWARKQIRAINSEISKKVNQLSSPTDFSKLESLRDTFYGRVSSIVHQIGKNLAFLGLARDQLKRLPHIDPEVTTIVVAGYPNVGKSMLVKQISSAKPTIAIYPFTTKQLNIGHLILDNTKLQIIDTPGLLDRSPEERNKIELQAIMALRYLADVIIFILDPSEHCGYTKEDQEKLLTEIQKLFNEIQIIEIENKVDLFKSDSKRYKISALTNQGLESLLEIIQESI
jgi:nucleolar GTP-binding protein